MTLALHSVWGVRAAAAGVAVGSLLMILTLLPTFVRLVPARRGDARPSAGRAPAPPCSAATVLAPVVLFVVSRQSQVLVERFLASSLPDGAISHLNYAQKVAQLPMVLSHDDLHGDVPRGRAGHGRRGPGGRPAAGRARSRAGRDRGAAGHGDGARLRAPDRRSPLPARRVRRRRTPPPPPGSCGSTRSVCSATPWSAPCAGRSSRPAGPPGTRSARWAPGSWSPPRPARC